MKHWSQLPPLENFLQRVEFDPNTGCWLWSGATWPSGYGKVKVRQSTMLAHRRSYELHCGPIPKGALVCHRCDTPACVNPAHLYAGTDADNSRDKIGRGRDRKAAGERNVNAKLTSAVVLEIRASREPTSKIAARLGLDHSTVWAARTGRTWRHLGGL